MAPSGVIGDPGAAELGVAMSNSLTFWRPELRLAVLEAPQTHLRDKFGGLPWGFPVDRWPRCADCGKALSHTFQLVHDAERLDLGRPGRSLVAFQCEHDPGMCDTWQLESGASAALIVEPEELQPGLTESPEPVPPIAEAFVARWHQGTDDVAEDAYDGLFDNAAYAALTAEASFFDHTKLGGAPHWVQSASEGPPRPLRFAGQFSETHRFDGPAPAADAVGVTVTRRTSGTYVRDEPSPGVERGPGLTHISVHPDTGAWTLSGANYGGGMAYLFVDPAVPAAAIFWQC